MVVFGTQALLIGNKCSEIPIGERLVAVEECARDEPETGGQADNDKKDNGGAGGFRDFIEEGDRGWATWAISS